MEYFLKLMRWLFGIVLYLLRVISFNKLPPIPTSHLLLEKNGKFLVIRRGDGAGLALPAGIINWMETPEQAAIRETEEETGIKAKVYSLVGVYSQPKFGITNINAIHIVYAGRTIGGHLKRSLEGIPFWISKQDILKAQPQLSQVFQDYVKRKS